MQKSHTVEIQPEQQYAISPTEAARRAGLGRTTIYAALKSGELKSLKIGARRLILVDTLRVWLARHEAA